MENLIKVLRTGLNSLIYIFIAYFHESIKIYKNSYIIEVNIVF